MMIVYQGGITHDAKNPFFVGEHQVYVCVIRSMYSLTPSSLA